MEGCAVFLIAVVLGIIAGIGAHAGWWTFIGVPAAIIGWAVIVGLIVFVVALCGIGILVIGDL